MGKTLTLEQIKARPLEELLQEVLQNQETVRINLPEGQAVELKPAPTLKPLTQLEGFVPPNWKDAIYGPK